jgi:hypothetical protein
MNQTLYLLTDDRRPVITEDPVEWQQWIDAGKNIVATTLVEDRVIVSTIFGAISHGDHQVLPKLFETDVFNGPLDGLKDSASTFEQALAQHHRMVWRAKQSLPKE